MGYLDEQVRNGLPVGDRGTTPLGGDLSYTHSTHGLNGYKRSSSHYEVSDTKCLTGGDNCREMNPRDSLTRKEFVFPILGLLPQ